MDIHLPYITTELTTSLSLEPNLLNNNLYNNLKDKLQNKLLDKCLELGYITKIYNISSYSNGLLVPEDFSGNVLFNIKYNARLCYPIKNTNIVAKISNITKVLIIANNGPIIIIIKINNFNNTNFEKNNKNELMYKKELLKIDDDIIVNVENVNINDKDSRIIVLGKLLNIANDNDKLKGYDKDKENINTIEEY